MTTYSLDILLFLFGTSLLFHVTGFSRGRSDGLVFPSFRIFQFIVIHIVKGFGIVNKAEVGVFLELSCFFLFFLSCFFDDPADVGNLTSGSSAFPKSSLDIWKSTVHVPLKPGLENSECYFASEMSVLRSWQYLLVTR